MRRATTDVACTEIECFANKNGYCTILVNNNFLGRACPFRKTEEQLVKEQKETEKRLDHLGGNYYYGT